MSCDNREVRPRQWQDNHWPSLVLRDTRINHITASSSKPHYLAPNNDDVTCLLPLRLPFNQVSGALCDSYNLMTACYCRWFCSRVLRLCSVEMKALHSCLVVIFSQRTDTQSDAVAHNIAHLLKRASLSSESANFSLDAKSAVISIGDNASTKALAGSICNRWDFRLLELRKWMLHIKT